VLVNTHVVVLFSLILSAAGAESAVAASLTVFIAGTAVTMARTAITEARALAGHSIATATLGRYGERVAVRRSRSGLGDKSRSRKGSSDRLTPGGSRQIRTITLLSSIRSRKRDLLSRRVEICHVVGRTVVVASTALIVDILTLAFPELTASVTRRRSGGVTLLGLSPACGTGVPTASLVAVLVKLDTVPVAVSDDAIARCKTFGLLLLSGLQLLVANVGGRRRNVNSGSRHRVGQRHRLVPDVEGGGRLVVIDIAGNRDGLLRKLGASRVEPDLSTASVELRITLVGIVESKKFGADQIVTTQKAIRNLDAEVAVVVDQLLGAPLASRLIVTLIPDLEPAIASALVVDSRVDFLEVNSARSLVRDVDAANRWVVRPVAEFEAENGATVGRTDASNTFGAIDTAGHVTAVKARDGVGGGVGISGHSDAGAIALSLAIDVEFGKERVCVDALCSHQGEHRNDGRNLHDVRRREKRRTAKSSKENTKRFKRSVGWI
jgi:hypothetical protein